MVPRTIEIVDQHDALALQHRAVGVVLQFYAHVADGIGRLDEGAADIVVADDAEIEGDAGGLREADRGGNARIGHRHDDVGGGRRLARELRADALAHFVDAGALHDRIGAGEIDLLEDAGALAHRRERFSRFDAALGDDEELARLDLAHQARADDVERAGLRYEHRRAVEIAQEERADAERVAAADQLLFGQRDQRIGALDLAERVDHALHQRAAVAGGDQVQDGLGVGGGLEDRAAALQFPLQRQRVGDVAVMRHGEAAADELGEERLHVAQVRAAGRGIAVVADGVFALQALHDGGLGEIVADQADMALAQELLAVEGDDAGRLLAAVLQRVQAERGERARLRVAENAEHAALFVQLVRVESVRQPVPHSLHLNLPEAPRSAAPARSGPPAHRPGRRRRGPARHPPAAPVPAPRRRRPAALPSSPPPRRAAAP